MQYELFSDTDFQQATPFTGRSVCLLGSVPKAMQQRMSALGATIKQSLSRNVHFVVLGKNVSSDQMEGLQQLAYNGFNPKVLGENDIESILQGHYSAYSVPEQITKDLHLTLRHYQNNQFRYEGSMNPLYMEELYLAADVPAELYQMLGNRGIYANAYIDDTTDVLVISDTSLRHLQEGGTDETLRYIENCYNQSRAQAFRYTMTSEGELLRWLRTREEGLGIED